MLWLDLRAWLATIGIGPGKTFDFKDRSLKHKAAVLLAVKERDDKITQYLDTGMKNINGWEVGAMFGDRGFFNSDWPKETPPSNPARRQLAAAGPSGGPIGRQRTQMVRRSRRRILPTVDLGSASRKTTVLGTL
ncbi:hypothetical protein [Candidatus Skiveiella danica]|uniref:hypothetical protein n=1 Tax=Candidatus Skiveiella danica TaxID=3386177 RepID=UPI001D36B094|nr:hypothetical protein [Betaproteobacteria bacterium]